MTSHELARLLLARRDNDLTFEVLVDLDPESDEDRAEPYETELRDLNGRVHSIPSDQVVSYDSENDQLVIRLGTIYPE